MITGLCAQRPTLLLVPIPSPNTFKILRQKIPSRNWCFFGRKEKNSKQTNTTLEEDSVARLCNLVFGNLIQYFSLQARRFNVRSRGSSYFVSVLRGTLLDRGPGRDGGSGGWKKNLRGSGAGMGVSNAPSSQAPGNTFDLCATCYYPAKGDPRTSPDL